MIVKAIYKTLRSVIFTVTLLVVGLYVLFYVLFSLPVFTNFVKDYAAAQLSEFLGAEVKIEDLNIYPFNEVKISNLEVSDPEGNKCISIETIGAGIRLWKLISEGKIELTFGEIIGLDANIRQEAENAPLNIDFLIKAFAPKQPQKEKTHFELTLRNVVLRKSAVSFQRPWLEGKKLGDLDLSDLRVTNMAADIMFPKISDREIEVDLRRLSLSVPGVLHIDKIGLLGHFSPSLIDVEDFILELPHSRIYIPSLSLSANSEGNFKEALETENQELRITESYLSPSDFSAFLPVLNEFSSQMPLEISATGNINEVTVENFMFGNPELFSLSFRALAEGLTQIETAKGDLIDLKLNVSQKLLSKVGTFLPNLKPEAWHIIENLGHLEVEGAVAADLAKKNISGDLELTSDAFDITADGEFQIDSKATLQGNIEVTLENLRLHHLLPQVPVENLNANIVAQGEYSKGLPDGMLSVVVEDFTYKGKPFEGFSLNFKKEDELLNLDLLLQNTIADLEARAEGNISSENQVLKFDMDLRRLDLSEIIDLKKYNGYQISGSINVDAEARGFNSLEGTLALNNFLFESPDGLHKLNLHRLKIEADKTDSIQSVVMKSDWADARIEGPFKIKELPVQIKALAASVMPAIIGNVAELQPHQLSDLEFDLVIKKNNSLPAFFNLPVRLLVPVAVAGSIEGSTNSAWVTVDIPYLQQGKDKLIYDTRINASVDGTDGTLNGLIETTLPVKKGDLALNINLWGEDNLLSTDIHWLNTENKDFHGLLSLETAFLRNQLSLKPEIDLTIKPGILQLGVADWHISQCEILYSGDTVEVKGLRISHADQFVEVEGVASPYYEDAVTVNLADIDVDYIFEMLQINYVTFGGTATGEISGHALLSGDPVAETESLVIKDFTYNGAAMGECKAASRWNNEQKEIEISADITQFGRQTVKASGGIWLGRDSLCFNIAANKVPVDFVQPFMQVFSSHVGGFASGDVKLFGNFHDIDMTGKIFADSVAVKLDYTNTVYHGSDSVFLNPGQIEIPNFRLYDKNGNSALLTGELSHRYFHDPSFTFRLSEADNFLCYDTTRELNPDWFGVLYGTGSAFVTGVPGLVDISADMTIGGNSTFTFVLNDTQYAQDYQFLTFSDRRAEEMKSSQVTPQDIKEMLRKSMHTDEGSLSKFGIDIRATVTPGLLVTLVMDPAAGDKITAHGNGALQMKYESDNDELMMYGKYEIEEGEYNFSLQDIILREFKIKEGSYIAFNGNPLTADLDISATYRVNTNLSDLDKSFSTDRDLNRTNVPVDAVLSVDGDMTSPNITFDIELPTLTQDVERKVKSIISTDDMMNRQIIYLLALNRFYTPEYMGATGNGGELAAVASSTISSQLTNILGQLTDKFSVAPSFRSDKGDFSDIEVDVALSSRLLNNRLLINGNFGYRDRSTSNTTFVGDFDVEYLLSKNGNLRLKAYNHFNDQNYYLREALTTQGLGIVYRKDFDNWFTFLKKKKPESSDQDDSNPSFPSPEESSDPETPEKAPEDTRPEELENVTHLISNGIED